MRLHNRRALKIRRQEFRASLTPAEARLWLHLKRGQLRGRKFRREHSIGAYIVDFYCPSERLAIELDGAAHDHAAAQAHDVRRSGYLGELRVRVIRFENRAVMENLEGVLAEIARHFAQ
jgi:very-short-patch-repair endonuclease